MEPAKFSKPCIVLHCFLLLDGVSRARYAFITLLKHGPQQEENVMSKAQFAISAACAVLLAGCIPPPPDHPGHYPQQPQQVQPSQQVQPPQRPLPPEQVKPVMPQQPEVSPPQHKLPGQIQKPRPAEFEQPGKRPPALQPNEFERPGRPQQSGNVVPSRPQVPNVNARPSLPARHPQSGKVVPSRPQPPNVNEAPQARPSLPARPVTSPNVRGVNKVPAPRTMDGRELTPEELLLLRKAAESRK